MSLFHRVVAHVCFSALLALGVSSTSLAQASAEAITLPVKIIDGRMVILADVTSQANSAPVSLLLELDANHEIAIAGPVLMGLMPAKGETSFSLSTRQGLEASVAFTLHPDMATLSRLTAHYANEIEQHAVSGSLGLGFFRKYHVVLDLERRELTLSPPRESGAALAQVQGDIVISPLAIREGAVTWPVRYGSNGVGEMRLTGGPDSHIDARIAKQLGAPVGDVRPVHIMDARSEQAFDVSRLVAFRPVAEKPAAEKPVILLAEAAGENKNEADKASAGKMPAFTAGVDLLRNFQVELDFVNGYAALTQTEVAEYPKDDFAFYQAEVLGGAAELLAFLEQYPQNRHAREAAALLVDRQIQAGASDAALLEAARWYRDTAPTGFKGEFGLTVMNRYARELKDRRELIVQTGDLALEAAEGDIEPLNVFFIYDTRGRQRLSAGDLVGAWKDFLSAAFGLPQDAPVSLHLARVYDKQGRERRAYSRYERALEMHQLALELPGRRRLSKEEIAEAKSAMERLRTQLGAHDALLAQ